MSPREDVAAWVRRQAAGEVLRRVVDALGLCGVRVLPVKGIVTAQLLYQDPAERHVGDIDLRISQADYRTALAVARARGWHFQVQDSPRLHEAVIKVDGCEVDIECTVGPPGLCAISVEQLISRAALVAKPFPHLEPELHDHALVLVLNAFKDGMRLAPWSLEDLRRIALLERFDPSLLVARAQQGRVMSALWLVADWLAERKQASAWSAVRDLAGPRPPSSRVAKVYGYMLTRGWPERLALLAVATSSDDLVRAASAVALAAAGLLKRRLRRFPAQR